MSLRRPAYLLIILLVAGFSLSVKGQNKYRVYFKNKQTTFNPYTYFDQKAIDRRLKLGLPLTDSTDFPVNETYVDAVNALVDSSRIPSRWFNCMAVFTNPTQAAKISGLPFVAKVQKLDAWENRPLLSKGFDTTVSKNNLKLLGIQIDMMAGNSFIEKGIDGKGVRIAVFDAGFPTVDKSPVFKHLRDENKIIATYDFGRKNEFVYGYYSHGTMVLACVAGKINGKNIGLATGAEFLLARTENPGYEVYPEEENWLAAAEWADKNGADIINSSLGYTNDLYFKNQMDGRHSIIARAATMAVKKGILVVNAAGNEGDVDWKIVASPGDADSVLTVGAINPYTGYQSSFSSYGPNKNFKLKPNVSAAGTVATAGKYILIESSGTSFASPLVAGFAACALQLNKNWTNLDLYTNIEKSAKLYPYFDYAHGYGVPQATYFVDSAKTITPTFEVNIQNGDLMVEVDTLNFNPAWPEQERLLYYHVENSKGYLKKYYLIAVEESSPLTIKSDEVLPGEILRIHYRGYTYQYTKPE